MKEPQTMRKAGVGDVRGLADTVSFVAAFAEEPLRAAAMVVVMSGSGGECGCRMRMRGYIK